ncbi:MAG: HAD family hydrolase [Dehalococcoidales bacterium]|nr:HAD family hydrolase [Dehalococcoidales bacterium]
MIKSVIFDWFNTLARYEPPRELVHSRALREFGINMDPVKLIKPLLVADKYYFEENIKEPIRNRSAAEQEKILFLYEQVLMTEAGLKFEVDLPPKVYLRGKELFGDTLDFVLFDEVLPVMKNLREKKLTIGLLTNYAKDMNPLINRLGLEKYIDFVVTPYDAGSDKPDPGIFRFALKQAGVTADEAIYVGDQYKVDIVGARNAGIKIALMIDRYSLSPEITDCPRMMSLLELDTYL